MGQITQAARRSPSPMWNGFGNSLYFSKITIAKFKKPVNTANKRIQMNSEKKTDNAAMGTTTNAKA